MQISATIQAWKLEHFVKHQSSLKSGKHWIARSHQVTGRQNGCVSALYPFRQRMCGVIIIPVWRDSA